MAHHICPLKEDNMATKGIKQAFAKRVEQLRESRGLTQDQLGRRVGVSQTCVWNWENANTFPRGAALKKLAQALQTTADYLEAGINGGSPTNTGAVTGGIPPALGDVILQARQQVANAAGAELGQVRVVIDWGE
jgi:transcriptional regulator with XRE-family HTH domain